MDIEITTEIDGEKYKGTYRVERGMIYVSSSFGFEYTQLGVSEPETLAELLLGEIIRKNKNKK